MENEQNLKAQIYTAIFESIIKGEYPPNHIIREKNLIERYGVSKSPVREALVALCNEGVLRSMPRYGYEVVRLTNYDVQNILNFRFILESGSLSQCIPSITAPKLAELEQINESCKIDPSADDIWSHWRKNCAFHLKLISFSNNEYSYGMLKKSLETLTRAYAQFYWSSWNAATLPSDTKYHPQLIEAIRSNHFEQAAEALRLDINDFGISNKQFV